MLVTAFLAASLSAPIPKEKPAELYFPTVVGTKRVIQRSKGPLPSETVEEVTKVEEKDGVYTVTLEWKAVTKGDATPAIAFPGVYEVSATKVVDVLGKNNRTVFDLEVASGKTWTWESASKAVTTYTAGKEEEVEVPAGKFKAIPITEQRRKNGSKTVRWYASGVGVVKEEVEFPSITVTGVLKEFTPGKAKEEKKEPEKKEKKDK